MPDNDLSYCGGCSGLDYRPLHDPGDPVLICSMILASAIISSPSPAAIKRGRGHEWSVEKPGAPIIGARFYCRRRPEGHDTHHAWLSAIIQRARARTPCLPVNGIQLDKTNTNLSFRFQGRRQARTVAYSETQAKLPVLLCRYIYGCSVTITAACTCAGITGRGPGPSLGLSGLDQSIVWFSVPV